MNIREVITRLEQLAKKHGDACEVTVMSAYPDEYADIDAIEYVAEAADDDQDDMVVPEQVVVYA